MKTFKKIVPAFLTLLVLGLSVNARAATDKENRKVSEFNAIHISSGIDLYLAMGNEEKVTIVADDDIIDDIITEVKDGVLNIYMKNRHNFFHWFWRGSRKAYVTAKTLEELHASSGSGVVSENTITGSSLDIRVSSGSDLRMDVDVENLSLKSSSGSDAKLTGRTKNFDANASSGSDINAGDLKTKICDVSVSSGSDASVNVSGKLTAHASSGGDIKYYGNPQYKDIHKSSGGDVYKH